MKYAFIPITKVDEPWCKVVLANDAIINYRTIIKGAYQVMNDDGTVRLENDQPLFGLDTQIIIAVEKGPAEKKEMN